MKLVYLAGPITGLSYEGCTSWRQYAMKQLKPLFGLSPMRGKDYLLKEVEIGDCYNETILSTQKAITARDRFDTQRADAVLVNLLGAERVSIGTMIELGWADAARVPIILIDDLENSLHNHAMVRELASFTCKTLDEGIDTAKQILIDGVL